MRLTAAAGRSILAPTKNGHGLSHSPALGVRPSAASVTGTRTLTPQMSISTSPAPPRTVTQATGNGPPVRHDPPIIVFENVSKTYGNGAPAVQDVSFTVRPRDFVFVVGASGAGKSTIIRLLIREETASKGHVIVEGQDLARLRHRHLPRLRRKMGIVFQDFKLLPNLTVAQNVAFAIQVTDPGRSHLKEKVGEALYIVGLEDKLNNFPTELSGGEQQRVAIARALIHRPRIFLADEPTGNLDPDAGWGIVQLLLQINHRGATVVMATHNREVVDLSRRRVLAMEGGQLIRDEQEGQYLKEGEAIL